MPKHIVLFILAAIVLLITLALILFSPFPFLGIPTAVITIGLVLAAALDMEEKQRHRDMHKK